MNFKEEIMAYPTMTQEIYNKLRVKVDEFMALKAVYNFGAWAEHYRNKEFLMVIQWTKSTFLRSSYTVI